MKDKYLTASAYARYRGVAKNTVFHAIRAGRIALTDVNGVKLVDVKQADDDWSANTDEEQSAKATPTPPPEQPQRGPTFQQSRAVREAYQAKLAKIEYEERTGKLIDSEQVKREAFDLARTVRDRILNVPGRISNEIISKKDPLEVEQLIYAELEDALKQLASIDDVG